MMGLSQNRHQGFFVKIPWFFSKKDEISNQVSQKEENILKVDNYCEPIIDINTWNATRNNLDELFNGNETDSKSS